MKKRSCLLGMDAIENHQFIIYGKLRVMLEGNTTEDELLLANPYQITIPPYKIVNCLLATSESEENEKLYSGKAQACRTGIRDIPSEMVNPGKAQACKTGISNIPSEMVNPGKAQAGQTGISNIPSEMVNPGKAQACNPGISNIPIEMINSRKDEVGETGRSNII